ncbi:putative aT9S [Mycobacterium xenopi 4042]|uniref:Putative aT9S n=1 Tax=Mycobacterium xenopi 4042 TaxID=1299334 RepID=X8CJP5_MYCXE|nr:putative aT9S [Mycobacterium xenopi 4042]
MEYCLGGDDGTAKIWDGQPDLDIDGDGRLDAVGLDFDADGLRDDALADFDGDGLADHAVLDLDNDGTAESYFTDDGTGTWSVAVDRGGQLRWFGLDGAEHTGGPLVDFDDDGRADDRLLDFDGNGLADRVLLTGDGDGYDTAYVDGDGDGRWDVKLSDSDGDGPPTPPPRCNPAGRQVSPRAGSE